MHFGESGAALNTGRAADEGPTTTLGPVVAAIARLLGAASVTVSRYAADGTSSVVAVHGDAGDAIGLREPADRDGIVQRIWRTGQPTQADGHSPARGTGRRAGAPIFVGGALWGAVSVDAQDGLAAVDAEDRLAACAELVAAAVAGQSGERVAGHETPEPAAVRRIAELVARGVDQRVLFESVTAEVSRLLDEGTVSIVKVEEDGSYTVVASCTGPLPAGARLEADVQGIVPVILRTGRPARVEASKPAATDGREDRVGWSVGVPVAVNDRVWGVLVARGGHSLQAGAEGRLAPIAALAGAALAHSEARAGLRQRADEQGALRRVAEFVARGDSPELVFDAVAREASRLLDGTPVTLSKFEPGEALVIMATYGGPAPIGARVVFEPGTLPAWVRDESRTVRVDDYSVERDADLGERFGVVASVAAPIVVDDEVWGMFTATSEVGPLDREAERRLQEFAELTAAAIGNAQAWSRVQELADEQGALRRVAEVVARGADLEEVFSTVAREASSLLGDRSAALMRHDPDDFGTVVATFNSPAPVGLRVPSGPDTPVGEMYRTGEPLRVGRMDDTPLEDVARQVGVTTAVAVPITVDGHIWGNLSTSSDGPPVPAGTEQRLRPFAELAGLAIANAKNRTDLSASRARVVAAADETRRRIQRDVHDGAQQRLVHTLFSLKSARERIAPGDPAVAFLDEAIAHAERASKELRDVVRGILPEALTRRGLRAGVRSLVTDLAVPVDVEVTELRFPPELETTAYFLIAEALTNVVKHACATMAQVMVAVEANVLSVIVRDDGIGGADPQRGSGLVGLLDRVEANEGTFVLSSPPGDGTTLHVRLPLGALTEPDAASAAT